MVRPEEEGPSIIPLMASSMRYVRSMSVPIRLRKRRETCKGMLGEFVNEGVDTDAVPTPLQIRRVRASRKPRMRSKMSGNKPHKLKTSPRFNGCASSSVRRNLVDRDFSLDSKGRERLGIKE